MVWDPVASLAISPEYRRRIVGRVLIVAFVKRDKQTSSFRLDGVYFEHGIL